MTSETDEQFLDRIERAVETTGDNWIRLIGLARRGAAVQWRPIEEAPMDGRWFLVGRPTAYDVVGGHTFWAATARFEYPDDTTPEMMMSNGEWGPLVCVTHWMPLPPPPAGEPRDE